MVSMSSSSQLSQTQETYGALIFSVLCVVISIIITGYIQKETMSPAEVDQFFEDVKKTFSDILFPIEYINKQDYLGKGNNGIIAIMCAYVHNYRLSLTLELSSYRSFWYGTQG